MKLLILDEEEEIEDYLEYLSKKEDVALLHENDIQRLTQTTSTDNSIAHLEENVQDTNIPDVFDTPISQGPPLIDVIHEIGLKGFAKEGKCPTSSEPACKRTFEKWYAILGYKDFKDSISAIHKSSIRNGKKWDRRMVKDVCYFVHYFTSRKYLIDFDILSKCLGNFHNGRPISTRDILDRITQENAGDTVLSLYNSWEKDNPLPSINDKERRRELH